MPPIDGTPGDDVLIGTTGDDIINGYAGNDQIAGLEGNDTIDGGDDHDFLRGQQGNDIIYGGNGDDLIRPGSGDDTVDGGSGWDRVSYAPTGTDTVTHGVTVSLLLQGVAQDTGYGMDTLSGIEHLTGTEFDDVLTGDGGDNWLWGGGGITTPGITGNDTIDGGGGNDLVEVGAGNHTLSGGIGTDTLSLFGNSSDMLAGVTFSLALQGAAQDTGQGMMTASGFENLSGAVHGDVLSGDGGDNVIAGDIGNDTLSGGAGNDTLLGDGRILADTQGLGFSGPITTYNDAAATFSLTPGNDLLDGGAGDDILDGGGGIDTASFASSTDAVTVALGPTGNGVANHEGGETDTLFNIENITGSAFNDFILGNDGANVLDGGAGGDALFGRGGDDTLIGGDGDDFLRGSDGADILDGGNGWDRVSSFVLSPTTGITFNLNIQGVAQDTGQGMDVLIGIEHASGTVLSDTLIGDTGSNWLWGGSDGEAGGGTGDDNISGGGGDDLVEVGAGNHTLDGGAGIDTLSFLGGHVEISTDGVTYSLALQGAAQVTEQGSMTSSGFENVSGSLYDDVLTGDGADNILLGDFGNDMLSGGDGNDTLYGDGRLWVDTSGGVGGSGPITLFANADDGAGLAAGNDTLIGGKGDDTLYGGQGDDVMTGDQGADRFMIEANSGNDTITDFKNVDAIIFDALSGVDDFSDLILTAVGGSDTLISWGTGDSILLQGVKPNQLDASDFEFEAAAASPSAGVAESLSRGSSFSMGYDHGVQAAAEIAIHTNALMDG